MDITYLNPDKYKKGENMKNIKNILVSVATVLFVAGCGSSGGGSSTATSGGGCDIGANGLSITSTSYKDGDVIPAQNAGSGANQSPQYAWIGMPDTVKSSAIIMDDEVSPCGTGVNACKHWALYNIPSNIVSVDADLNINTIPGTTEGLTYDGVTVDYNGPNPPSTHTYKTTVYLLNTATNIPSGTAHTRASFEAEYCSQIISKATYTGTYGP